MLSSANGLVDLVFGVPLFRTSYRQRVGTVLLFRLAAICVFSLRESSRMYVQGDEEKRGTRPILKQPSALPVRRHCATDFSARCCAPLGNSCGGLSESPRTVRSRHRKTTTHGPSDLQTKGCAPSPAPREKRTPSGRTLGEAGVGKLQAYHTCNNFVVVL